MTAKNTNSGAGTAAGTPPVKRGPGKPRGLPKSGENAEAEIGHQISYAYEPGVGEIRLSGGRGMTSLLPFRQAETRILPPRT